MAEDKFTIIGRWAFIAGVLLAIVAGIADLLQGLEWILVVLGLIVGFFNITPKESTPFLIAAIALLAASTGGTVLETLPGIGDLLSKIFGKIVLFVAPAAVVVALREVVGLAQTK